MRLPHVSLNRHLLIIIVCAVLVFALGVISNQAWHSTVVKTQAAAAKNLIIAADAKRRQAHEVAVEKARLKAECDKEVAYYNSLTASQKAKQIAPACQNLVTVQ